MNPLKIEYALASPSLRVPRPTVNMAAMAESIANTAPNSTLIAQYHVPHHAASATTVRFFVPIRYWITGSGTPHVNCRNLTARSCLGDSLERLSLAGRVLSTDAPVRSPLGAECMAVTRTVSPGFSGAICASSWGYRGDGSGGSARSSGQPPRERAPIYSGEYLQRGTPQD